MAAVYHKPARSHLPGARVYDLYVWGGYLIHELYPQKVFVDGRSDLYGDTLLRDYYDVLYLKPDWQQVLEKYGVDAVIVDKDSPLSQRLALSNAWQRGFTGPVEVVYFRTKPAGQ